MKLHVVIDNFYGGEPITSEYDLDVDEPERGLNSDLMEEWAYDTIFPYTGTGREHGDAAYFATITRCEARPDLEGREFEWGT